MRQEQAFKFYWDTGNKGALPLDPACPEHLSVRSPALRPYHFFKLLSAVTMCTELYVLHLFGYSGRFEKQNAYFSAK
jgi:hypothetical protein